MKVPKLRVVDEDFEYFYVEFYWESYNEVYYVDANGILHFKHKEHELAVLRYLDTIHKPFRVYLFSSKLDYYEEQGELTMVSVVNYESQTEWDTD